MKNRCGVFYRQKFPSVAEWLNFASGETGKEYVSRRLSEWGRKP